MEELVLLAIDRDAEHSPSEPEGQTASSDRQDWPDVPGCSLEVTCSPRQETVTGRPSDCIAPTASSRSSPRSLQGCTLTQQAVTTMAPATYEAMSTWKAQQLQKEQDMPVLGPPGGLRPGQLPPDCVHDNSKYGCTTFAALPLSSGDGLLGVLWIAAAPPTPVQPSSPRKASTPAPPQLPSALDAMCRRPSSLRQLANSATLCLAGAASQDYTSWLAGALGRIAGSTALLSLVGELCEVVAQHIRRRFMVDTAVQAAVVPKPGAQVAFMLEHRTQVPTGASLGFMPGGLAAALGHGGGVGSRFGSMAKVDMASMSLGAAPRQSSILSMVGTPAGNRTAAANGTSSVLHPPNSATPPSLPRAPPSNASIGRIVKRSSSSSMTPGKPPLPESAQGRGGDESTPLANPVPSSRWRHPQGLVGDHTAPPSSGGPRFSVVPSLRAKAFQLSHTLLARMVADNARGPAGVCAGCTVPDCARYVQDVHAPSRDVCMLMAGGARGGELAGDASEGGFGDRSTGRVMVQSLVVLGVDAGQGAVLGLYLPFPTRLPGQLLSAVHTSSCALLSTMLARLLRHKIATDLATEWATLCTGVPGSYAVRSPAVSQPAGAARKSVEASGLGPSSAAAALAAATAAAAIAAANGTGSSVAQPRLRPFLEPSLGSTPKLPVGGPAAATAAALNGAVRLWAAESALRDKTEGSTRGLMRLEPQSQASPTSPLAQDQDRLFMLTEDGCGPPERERSPAGVRTPPPKPPTPSLERAVGAGGTSAARLAPCPSEGGFTADTDTDLMASTGADVMLRSDSQAEGDDVFIDGGLAEDDAGPPDAPAAMLTVQQADGTCSMRHHMGLLVDSIMATLCAPAQMDRDAALAGSSLDLELDDLHLSGLLGDGGSGVVLRGMLATVPVAVKLIQMPEVDSLLSATAQLAVVGGPGAQAHRAPAAGGDAVAGGSGQPGSELRQAQRDMLRNAMELAVMRSISHINIVQVFAVYDNVALERIKREDGATAFKLRRQAPEDAGESGKSGASPVFVAVCMELCECGSLASKLEDRTFPRQVEAPALPQPQVPEGGSAPLQRQRYVDMRGVYLTVLEIACSLRYLHARRLIHRDIKSANILLRASATDPRGWTCKLADFGSAIVADQYQPYTEEGEGGAANAESGPMPGGVWYAIQEQSWGTITHMSPEMMDNGSRIDASSDMFAFGIVMWEIVSGRGYRPYRELEPELIGAAVRAGRRPKFTPEVPAPYRALAQACWSAEPGKRPSAAAAVAAIKAQLGQLQAEARRRAGGRAAAAQARA